MAKMISFVNFNTKGYVKNVAQIKNQVESDLLQLGKMVDEKSYLNDYSTGLKLVYNIYENITKDEHTLATIIKSVFQGSLTKGIYSLIIQDVWDLLTEGKVTDFIKYYKLVEDKEDILIEANEYGTKLEAFNTTITLEKGTTNTAVSVIDNKTTELFTIVRLLGVSGSYYFFKALLKIVAVAK